MQPKGKSDGKGNNEDGHEFWDDVEEDNTEKEENEDERGKETAEEDLKRSSPAAEGKRSPPQAAVEPRAKPEENSLREKSPAASVLCGLDGAGDSAASVAAEAPQTVANKVPNEAPDNSKNTAAEEHQQPSVVAGVQQHEEEADFDHLEKAAEDLVATLASEVGVDCLCVMI